MIYPKSQKEIEIMRQGGQILASVLRELALQAVPGARLSDIDILADSLIRERGGVPSFKNYQPSGATKPYPASVCLSINDEVVHGLPDNRKLRSGDLLKIDCGVFFNGFHTDSAVTIAVGETDKETRNLIFATEHALEQAIKKVHSGARLGDVGHVIESVAREYGYSSIRELSGHGIGRALHEDPNVLNFGKPGDGPELRDGMTIAIEPMIAAGKGDIFLADDGFTYKTRDGSRVAHFEHTVAVTKEGAAILTQR